MRDPVPDDIWKTQITPTERDPVPQDIWGSQEKKPAPAPDLAPSVDDLTWRQAIWSAIQPKTLGKSAYQYGSDIVGAIKHPVETGKAVMKTAVGAAEKLVPGEHPYEEYADLFVDIMKNRYGTVENFKRTLAEDPVGVTADLASLFMAGGTVVRGMGMGTKVSAAGAKVAKLGAAMEPLNVAARGVAAPVRAGLKLIPESFKLSPSKMYRSAVKFSTTLSENERLALARTALDEQIMPTLAGMEKLTDRITDISTRIDDLIEKASINGQKMPVKDLFKEFDILKKEALSTSGKPIKAEKAIERVRTEIIKANEKLGRKELTPLEAQALKKKIYRELESFYSRVRELPASVDAQMAVARATKEFLEEAIIDEKGRSVIKQLNKEDGALIELRKHLDRPASRISNRDIWGLGMTTKMGLGGLVGHGIAGGGAGTIGGTATGLVLGLLDTPQAKSGLAIFLNRLQKRGIKVRMTPTLARLLARSGEQVQTAIGP